MYVAYNIYNIFLIDATEHKTVMRCASLTDRSESRHKNACA